MISERMAWRGLRSRLDEHGVPAMFAMQLAGACYPLGTTEEARVSTLDLARSRVSPYEAREIVEKLLAVPKSSTESLLTPSLQEIFGRQQVEAWTNPVVPDREPDNQATSVEGQRQAPLAPAENTKSERCSDDHRANWIPFAIAGLLLTLAGGTALVNQGESQSPPKKSVSKPPRSIPRKSMRATKLYSLPSSTVSRSSKSAEVTLAKTVASARELLSKNEYHSAIKALEPFFEKNRHVGISDKRLWADYLKVIADSRMKEYRAREGTRTENEAYEHWPAVHDIGLAWHHLMKEALAERRLDLANEAFLEADNHYKAVLVAVGSGGKNPPASGWRRTVYGWAIANRGIIRSQLGRMTRDEKMNNDARQLLKVARFFLSQYSSNDKDTYKQVVDELRN